MNMKITLLALMSTSMIIISPVSLACDYGGCDAPPPCDSCFQESIPYCDHMGNVGNAPLDDFSSVEPDLNVAGSYVAPSSLHHGYNHYHNDSYYHHYHYHYEDSFTGYITQLPDGWMIGD